MDLFKVQGIFCVTASPLHPFHYIASTSIKSSNCIVSKLIVSSLILLHRALSHPIPSPSLHVMVGIVGLKDPLREGVVEAVHRIQDSGAKVCRTH